MIRFVEFMPEEFAEQIDPTDLSSQPLGIISLTDPGRQAKLQPGWAEILRLQFNDVDPEYLANLDESDRAGKVLFNEGHARKIVNWLNKNKDKLGGLIVHCWAGISRSGAVAKFVADKLGLPYREGHDEFINQHIYDLLQAADQGKMKHTAAIPRKIKVNDRYYRLATHTRQRGAVRLNGYLYVPAEGKKQVRLMKEWEKEVENWRTGEPMTQKLKLYKAVDSDEYFLASYSPLADETQIFPTNETGTDFNAGQTLGLGVGGEDFEYVLKDVGFEVVP